MDLREYGRWLKLRRDRAWSAASELADWAARQGRPLSPAEKIDYERLCAAIDHIDGKIRQAAIEARRDDHPRRQASVHQWAADQRGTSYSRAPGSGDPRMIERGLRR